MSERDDRGRFVAGNKASPGRNPRRKEQDYLDTVISQVSLADWRKVVKKALDDALAGDRYARTWLAEYVMGKPAQILELRGQDVNLLAELLAQFKARGMSPSDIFESMLVMLAEEAQDDD